VSIVSLYVSANRLQRIRKVAHGVLAVFDAGAAGLKALDCPVDLGRHEVVRRPLRDRRAQELPELSGGRLDDLALQVHLVGRVVQAKDPVHLAAELDLAFHPVERGVVHPATVVAVIVPVQRLRDKVVHDLDDVEQGVGVP
jgi:hypothetical protein